MYTHVQVLNHCVVICKSSVYFYWRSDQASLKIEHDKEQPSTEKNVNDHIHVFGNFFVSTSGHTFMFFVICVAICV